MRTATPLLISLEEAAFQLSVPREEVVALIHEGDLTAVKVREHVLVAYDSLLAFTRRVKRNSTVVEVVQHTGV
jgi:excisionase family DNA binding protein